MHSVTRGRQIQQTKASLFTQLMVYILLSAFLHQHSASEMTYIYCVEWGVKLFSLTHSLLHQHSASKMTYIVLSGALNSTHSLTHSFTNTPPPKWPIYIVLSGALNSTHSLTHSFTNTLHSSQNQNQIPFTDSFPLHTQPINTVVFRHMKPHFLKLTFNL